MLLAGPSPRRSLGHYGARAMESALLSSGGCWTTEGSSLGCWYTNIPGREGWKTVGLSPSQAAEETQERKRWEGEDEKGKRGSRERQTGREGGKKGRGGEE